jgi:hypothetical protein
LYFFIEEKEGRSGLARVEKERKRERERERESEKLTRGGGRIEMSRKKLILAPYICICFVIP